MAGHVLARDLHLRIERTTEAPALVVVGEAVEQRAAQPFQVPGRFGRGVDRLDALLSIEGVRRLEERVVLGGDEVVQRLFGARVCRRSPVRGRPSDRAAEGVPARPRERTSSRGG
jgi:hypothetical protein